MQKLMLIATTAVAALVFGGAAQAQSQLAAGAHVGTTGIGAELFYNINPLLTVRAGGDYGKLDVDLNSNDIEYSGEAEWKTFNIGIDLHPWSTPFFVSGAVYFGDRGADIDALSARNQVLQGVVYTPAQIGTINGKAELSDTSGFVGLGWDNTFHSEGNWGFRGLVGAAFSDDPSVTLTATGPFANDPRVQTYLREEEREIADDADGFNVYPVVSVGLNYRF